jgi:hypothetical protein
LWLFFIVKGVFVMQFNRLCIFILSILFMPLAIANDAFNVDSITLLEQLLGAFDWSKLSTIGYVQVLVWVLCAFIGAVFHFYVDYKKGILAIGGFAGLFQYLFVDHVGDTIKTVFAIGIAGGAWFTANVIPAPWTTLIMSALMFGYGFDSILNRGLTTVTPR